MLNIWLVLILPTHVFPRCEFPELAFLQWMATTSRLEYFLLGFVPFCLFYIFSLFGVFCCCLGFLKFFFPLFVLRGFSAFFLFWLWYIFLYTHVFIFKANLHREDQKHCCENHISVNSWCKSLLMLQKGMENSTGRNRTFLMAASWFHVPGKAFIQN